jgi:hypothetical protein
MNDLTDKNGELIRDLTTDAPTLHLELHELRKRLAALEATLPQRQQTVGKLRGRATPKMIAFLIAGVMLAGATIVFGQDAVDSLFVSKDGNVGIGTSAPKQKLEIRDGDGLIQIGRTAPTLVKGSDNGGAIYFGVDRTGGIDQPTAAIETSWGGTNNPQIGIGVTREFSGRPGANLLMDFSGNANIRQGLTSRFFVQGGTGNVGIGTTTPAAKLDIKDRVALQDSNGRNYFKDVERNDGKGLRVGALWSQYGIYAETGMGALGGADGVTLQNGALTINSAGDITMSGNASAASFNGDKQPYVFEVGNKADTTNWYAVQVPSDIIQRYLGDANGGTIRISLRVNNSDEVRTITETIYIEQPDKSNNRNAGLHGWTRQGGGGDTGFVLDTSNRTDVIPHPWDWIWVRNYASPEPPGRGGNTGAAWTGDHKYRLEFMTRPNISATVIIYDR